MVDRTQRGRKRNNRDDDFKKLLNKQCPLHPKAKHSILECINLRKAINEHPLEEEKKKNKEDDEDQDPPNQQGFHQPVQVVNIIFGGESSISKHAQKLAWCEILSLEPAIPWPLKHSEVPITFSREDQWTSFSEPGKNSRSSWTRSWLDPD